MSAVRLFVRRDDAFLVVGDAACCPRGAEPAPLDALRGRRWRRVMRSREEGGGFRSASNLDVEALLREVA